MLPFTHGIETELAIVKNNGRWLEGSKMPGVFSQLVQVGFEELKRLLSSPNVPSDVASKTGQLEIRNITDPGHNRGEVILAQYELDGHVREFEVFGRDSHGAGATWILEIATPPCKTLEELEWWCHALFRSAHVAVNKIPGVTLITTAINPLEEYSVGISFGDHHHIGISDERSKRAAYDMIRAYIPQLMSISVNSPFSGGRIPEINMTPKGHIQVKSMVDPFSIRLQENIQQLGPKDELHYIPHLREGEGIEHFQKATNKATAQDSRFVDMYPFTRFGTIEVRFFDAQLCIADRMALVLLLQCLAWKGAEMMENGKEPVEVNQKSIVKNRDNSILKGGLIGLARDKDLAERDREFHSVYEGTTAGEGKKVQYIFESAQNMVYFVREEMERLGVVGTRYLDPAITMLWGGKRGRLTPPISPAQLQMLVVKDNGGDLQGLVNYLDGVSDMVATNPSYCPIVEELGSPLSPSFLQPVAMDLDLKIPSLVISGESVDLGVSLLNRGKAATDLMVRVTVQDDSAREVLRTEQPIGTLDPDKSHAFEVDLKTDEQVGNYHLQMEVFRGTKLLAQESRGFRAHRFTEKVSHMGPDVYLDLTPSDSIPFIVEVGNGFPHTVQVVVRIALEDVASGETLGEVEIPLTMSSLSKTLLAPKEGLSELARAILKGQEHIVTPALMPRQLKAAKRTVVKSTVISDTGKELVVSRSKPFLLRSRVSRGGHPSVSVTKGIAGVEYLEGDELSLTLETSMEDGAPQREVDVLVTSKRLRHQVATLNVEAGGIAHDLAFKLPTQFFNLHSGEAHLVVRAKDDAQLARELLPLVPRPTVKLDVRDISEVSPGRLEGSISLRSVTDLDEVLLKAQVLAEAPTPTEGQKAGEPLKLGEASFGPVAIRRGKVFETTLDVACDADLAVRPGGGEIPVVLEVAVVHRDRAAKTVKRATALSSPGDALRGEVKVRTSFVSADEAGVVLRCGLISRRTVDGINLGLGLPDGRRMDLGKGLTVGSTPVQVDVTVPWDWLVPDDPSVARPDPTLEVRRGHAPIMDEGIGSVVEETLSGIAEHLRLGLVSKPRMVGGKMVLPGPQSMIEMRPVIKCSEQRPLDVPVHLRALIAKDDAIVHQWSSEVKPLRSKHAGSQFAWTPPEDADGSYRLDLELRLRGRTLASRTFDFTLSQAPTS